MHDAALTGNPEAEARGYLLDFCWPGGDRYCVKCKAESPYVLKTGRLRCTRCGYTFHDFSGRWINSGNMSCRAWLDLLELFIAEKTINVVSSELGVSYNTAYKAVSAIRRSILAHALDAPVLLAPETGLGLLPGKANNEAARQSPKSPVFGIVEESGFVFADFLPDFSAETILHFKINFKLKTTRIGGLVFSDPYRKYSTLVCCPGDEVESEYFGSDESAAPLGEKSDFWVYARERITRFHGVKKQHFPLYLKELEFRYNHRQQDIMSILSQYLCALVPKFD